MSHITSDRTALRRAKIEQSPRIQSIKRWYDKNEVPVTEIAGAFNTSTGAIYALARKYNWPRRAGDLG